MKKQILNGVILLGAIAITICACKKEEEPVVVVPTVTTSAVTDIGYNTAKCGGNVTSEGEGTITARGIVYGGASGPTLENANKTSDGTGVGSFTSTMTGLAPGVTYHVRAYATNSAGTSYGTEKTFTTLVK